MISWIKNNRLTAVLLLVVAYFVYTNFVPRYFGVSNMMLEKSYPAMAEIAVDEAVSLGAPGTTSYRGGIVPPSPPVFEDVVDTDNRLVIQNSSMSLLVSDVRKAGNEVVKFAEANGGFMVNASYNQPEESAFGTVTVRVSTDKLNDALSFYRGLAVKVTNENLQGTDVTEQYTDIEARLKTLDKTKAKFEEILDSATRVQDILQVQQNIINVQSQIDRLVGQRKSLEASASLTKMTVYLSTDELSLPYTPDNKFRPGVIFKLAVRSLVGSFYGLGERLIWLVVYSVLWIPALIIFKFAWKYLSKKNI